MGFKTNPIGFRVGRVLFWKNCDFVDWRSGFSFINTKYRGSYFNLWILNYFNSVLNLISCDHKFLDYNKNYNLFKFCRIPESDSIHLKTYVLLGSSFVKYRQGKIFVYLNYYYDLNNNSLKKSHYLNRQLKNLTLRLTKIVGIKIVLLDFNYYNFFLNPILNKFNINSIKHEKNFNINFLQINSYKFKELYIYKKISFFYKKINLHYSLFRFSRNRYFYRIFNVFFCAHMSANLDWNMILNSINLEFKNLRKRHRPFLFYIFALFKRFWLLFSNLKGLRGLKLIFQGRMVPYNREHTRSIKNILLLGSIGLSNLNYNVKEYSSPSVSRFGSINIRLYIRRNFFLIKSNSSFDANIISKFFGQLKETKLNNMKKYVDIYSFNRNNRLKSMGFFLFNSYSNRNLQDKYYFVYLVRSLKIFYPYLVKNLVIIFRDYFCNSISNKKFRKIFILYFKLESDFIFKIFDHTLTCRLIIFKLLIIFYKFFYKFLFIGSTPLKKFQNSWSVQNKSINQFDYQILLYNYVLSKPLLNLEKLKLFLFKLKLFLFIVFYSVSFYSKLIFFFFFMQYSKPTQYNFLFNGMLKDIFGYLYINNYLNIFKKWIKLTKIWCFFFIEIFFFKIKTSIICFYRVLNIFFFFFITICSNNTIKNYFIVCNYYLSNGGKSLLLSNSSSFNFFFFNCLSLGDFWRATHKFVINNYKAIKIRSDEFYKNSLKFYFIFLYKKVILYAHILFKIIFVNKIILKKGQIFKSFLLTEFFFFFFFDFLKILFFKFDKKCKKTDVQTLLKNTYVYNLLPIKFLNSNIEFSVLRKFIGFFFFKAPFNEKFSINFKNNFFIFYETLFKKSPAFTLLKSKNVYSHF